MKIEFSREEAMGIVNAVDMVVRSQGLQAAMFGMTISSRIEQAILEENKQNAIAEAKANEKPKKVKSE